MIRLEQVTKRYKIYPRYLDRLKELLLGWKRRYYVEFVALRNISFEVEPGVAVGIIGENGSGKTTLLSLLGGITKPTEGHLGVPGKVGTLMELGAGFHPDLTGKENIFLAGRMYGLHDEEIENRLPAIQDYAELGDFFHRQLRTYSAGMQLRLGFALMTHMDVDVLLIDEILSVGDAYFQAKCFETLEDFKKRGTSLLIASHDLAAVKTICDQAILLQQGELIAIGPPQDVIEEYNAILTQKTQQRSVGRILTRSMKTEQSSSPRSGNFMAVVSDVTLLNQDGKTVQAVVAGEPITLCVRVLFFQSCINPTVGILLRDRLGQDVFGTNTFNLRQHLGRCEQGREVEVRFTFDLNIGPGEYSLTAAVHTKGIHLEECYDWVDRVIAFRVLPGSDFHFIGTAKLVPKVEIHHDSGPPADQQVAAVLSNLLQEIPSALTMGEDHDPFLRKGWYHPEHHEEGVVRWTEQECYWFLCLEGSDLSIEVRNNRPDIRMQPTNGIVYIGEQVLGSFRLNNHDWHTLCWTVPESWRGRIAMLRLDLDSTWKPTLYPPHGDPRELGVMIKLIECRGGNQS
jgi:lipopolysaccharide transport system ATP-binding protein